MSGLDYPAIWDLSRQEAEQDAALMWHPEEQKERYREAVSRLTVKYYRERVTPPSRCAGDGRSEG